jgi:dienelactone hydrolase
MMRPSPLFFPIACVLAVAIGCGGSDGDAGSGADAGDASTGDGAITGDGAMNGDGATGDDAANDGTSAGDGGGGDGSLLDGADGGTTPYDHDGTDTFTTFSASLVNGGSSFTEIVYVPASAGAHPVVSLSPGLQQPASAYTSYATRLASWGFVVLLRDDPGAFVVTPTVTADLAYVVATWLPAQNADTTSALHGKVDLARVGLSGHSRGSQASLVAAENALKGKTIAWFGIDAVDSTTLSGGTQARTTIATVGIPLAWVGGSVSSSCSPAADNYTVEYAAAVSPAVSVTGVGAGHTQFEDQAACVACNLCTPQGTANAAVVLAYAVRYLTAFFARELLHDASVGAAFQGAGAPADIAAGRVTIVSK